MSDWYNETGSPTTGSTASSSVMRSEFSAISDAMDKLPSLNSANANLPVFVAAGGGSLVAESASSARTKLGLSIGNNVQAWDADLDALAALDATVGVLIRDAANNFVRRVIVGTANELTVTNGNGVAGNISLSLPSALTFTGKTVQNGTFNNPAITNLNNLNVALGNLTVSTGQILVNNGTYSVSAIAIGGSAPTGGFVRGTSSHRGIDVTDGAVAYVRLADGSQSSFGVLVAGNSHIGWNSGAFTQNATSTPDVLLFRDAAASLAQRNGTNPQNFRIYNTFTDSGNYERLDMRWVSNAVAIRSAQAGTGTARALSIGTDGGATLSLTTNGTTRWTIDPTGHLAAQSAALSIACNNFAANASTVNIVNETATTVRAFGAATTLLLGAVGGTNTISGSTTFTSNLGTIAELKADGGLITSNQATVTLLNTTTTTVDAFGAATTLNVGNNNATIRFGGSTSPQNSQSANYTTVAGDAGGHIHHPLADNNVRVFTIANNATVPYPLGTAIMFTNDAPANVTIAINSDTLILAGTATTGNRTLTSNGVAIARKVTTTSWRISNEGGLS